LGWKIGVLFALGLAIILGVGILSYQSVGQMREADKWVAHTHQVLEESEKVLSVLKDAETGQRGFILTDEERYLEPYNAAAGEIKKDLDTLASLTQDNRDQQESIRQLRILTDAKLKELQETIELRQAGHQDEAVAVIRTDRGKRIMDDIRQVVAQMGNHEQRLLETRGKSAAETARHTVLMITVGVFLSLLVLGIAAIIIVRTMRTGEMVRMSGGQGAKNFLVRYGFAVFMVAVAAVLRWWLGDLSAAFIFFYPAVLLVALVMGGLPGILATALSAVVIDYWFMAPYGSFGIENSGQAVSLGIFTGVGIVLCMLSERLRRARLAEAISLTQEQELDLLDKGSLAALDADHRIVRWSEGCRGLYGFTAEEAKGQLVDELLQTHFQRSQEQLDQTLLEKGNWEGELLRRTKSGEELTVAVLWALRRDQEGRPSAILEVSTDLTRQKQAEDVLRQQAEELAQQNEELAEQSEELSQQTEEMTQQNEELQSQSEEIQTINSELAHREELLQKLLDAARLATAEQTVIRELCQTALGLFGPAAAALAVYEQQDDRLVVRAHAGLGPADREVEGLPVERSFAALVMRENKTACLADASLRPDLSLLEVPGQEPFRSVLAAPMHDGGAPFGAVAIYSRQAQQWTDEQFRLAEWLAAQCSHIMETLRLQEQLRATAEENRLLSDLLQRSEQPFGVGYPDGRLGHVNGAFERLTGYSRDELGKMDWTNTLTPPRWREIEGAKLAELQHTGRPVRYEKEYQRKDGSLVPIELLVHLVKDEHDKPLYYYSFITDLTERQRAEEMRSRLAAIVESSDDAIMSKDLHGTILTWNAGAERLFGYRAEEAVGQPIALLLPPDRLTEEDDILAKLQAGQRVEHLETVRLTKDGRRIEVLVTSSPLKDQAGRIIGASKIVHDITNRKRAEEALRQTAAELARSNKDLEQFAYISSHDLQEPLRTVSNFAQLLHDRYRGQLDARADEYIGFTIDGARRMQSLVSDLLAYSCIDTKGQKMKPTDSKVALAAAVANLKTSIDEAGASVTHDALPEVLADGFQLTQLFQNLIGNAVKFRGARQPEIHVGAQRQDGQRLFSVKDNGIGIDPQFQERIFLIFQRLHSRDKYAGTGIGLSICKKIVERHGGRIWIESQPGQGTTFFFTIPDRKGGRDA
jgi:PAS domain S-box-containing protein